MRSYRGVARRWGNDPDAITALAAYALLALFIAPAHAQQPREAISASRQAFDEMSAVYLKSIDWASADSDMAWGVAYLLWAYLDMHEATGDIAYLERFRQVADNCLATRDDFRGRRDWRGQISPGWSLPPRGTIAELTLRDTEGRALILVRSALYGYNDQTKVTVTPGERPDLFDLTVENEYYASVGSSAGREQFRDLSLDRRSDRYFERVVNDWSNVWPPHHGRRYSRGAAISVTLLDLRLQDSGGRAMLRTPPARLAPVSAEPLKPFAVCFAPVIGPIFAPYAVFCRRVSGDPALKTRFGADVRRYIKAMEQSLAWWGELWREGPGPGEGHYLYAPKGEKLQSDGVVAPLNYLMATARVHLALAQLTGSAHHLDRARKLARLFRNRLQMASSDSPQAYDRGETSPAATAPYVWTYWWGPGVEGWTKQDGISLYSPQRGPNRAAEDISHALHELNAAIDFYHQGEVFDETDMRRFAATFTENLAKALPDHFTSRVDGDVRDVGLSDIAAGVWLDLCEWDRRIYDMVQGAMARNKMDRGYYGFYLMVYARLLKWQGRLGSG